MTFRTRLLVIFTIAIVAAVGLVELLVTENTREAFERMEGQRARALVSQFRKEFDRRGQEIVREIRAIAQTETAQRLAIAPESSDGSEASSLAAAHGMDLLELVSADATILSSAQWPARFQYKEEWLPGRDWESVGAFLRKEELPDGFTVSLVAVAKAKVADRVLYVTGGQQLDKEFLNTLVLPAGMRVLLYRNLDPQFSGKELLGASGSDVVRLRPLIDRTRAGGGETSSTVGSGQNAETFYSIPLNGPDQNLLGVLLIGSSRRELVVLERSMRSIGFVVAFSGILVGLILTWWATARVTRPVRRLAESAGKVAAGNWGATVQIGSADEIGQLARAFNRMTQQLMEQRERLVQAERVAAWRELARRLAHELKNPLFPLQITVENMQRARRDYPEQFDEVFREGTSTLLAELANLKAIVGRFSDFARMPPPEMQPVDLNDLARETLKLFEPQLAKAGIAAQADLDAKLPVINGDREQLGRALRNLVLNAIDAMPSGGTLTVRSRALAPGVRLEIQDTGQGLTPEECERLFTPYYTTKTHGTGLGLAIVQSVISDHKGRISVSSSPGKGATFQIDLM